MISLSTKIFIGLITIIIFARGVIQLNEQLLVAICFIAFCYLTYNKVGSDIFTFFNSRGNQLIQEQKRLQQLSYEEFNTMISQEQNRIEVAQRIQVLSSIFQSRLIFYLDSRRKELLVTRSSHFKSQLDSLLNKELNFRKQLHLEFINKFIATLKINLANTQIHEVPNLSLSIYQQNKLPIASLYALSII
jgi:hypothetical protein